MNCLVVKASEKARSTVTGSTEERCDKSTRRRQDKDRKVTGENEESCEDGEKKGGGKGVRVFLLIHIIKTVYNK